MLKILKNFLMISIIVFVLYWAFSLAICEWNTFKHSEEFRGIGDIVDSSSVIKVLNYTENLARTYCVSEKYGNGNVFIYKKINDVWYLDKWEKTVWSRNGSADGFIWPYIR